MAVCNYRIFTFHHLFAFSYYPVVDPYHLNLVSVQSNYLPQVYCSLLYYYRACLIGRPVVRPSDWPVAAAVDGTMMMIAHPDWLIFLPDSSSAIRTVVSSLLALPGVPVFRIISPKFFFTTVFFSLVFYLYS